MVSSDGRELEVLVGAGVDSAEALMLVGRPRADGQVIVRAWTSRDWSRAPDARERRAAELLAEIEGAVRAGRSLHPELGTIRDWLSRP